MSVQLITQNDKPEWAVIPYDLYLQLVEKAEMLQDIQDFNRIQAAIERGEEELIPGEVVDALLKGENPLKVWREFRGLTQEDVAKKAGISVPYLSQLETQRRKGSVKVLSAIAKALQVSVEDLMPASPDAG